MHFASELSGVDLECAHAAGSVFSLMRCSGQQEWSWDPADTPSSGRPFSAGKRRAGQRRAVLRVAGGVWGERGVFLVLENRER